MKLLYSVFIALFNITSKIAALFAPKARAFVDGRRGLLENLETSFHNNTYPVVWMHCASLGEFEQGRPILEKIREEHPGYRMLLTFFSPSGYSVQKNYEKADFVCYLPLDTAPNAKRFVSIAKPALAIFVKYEFWYHYLTELRKQEVPVISISAIFRKDQLFFKFYGGFFREMLRSFEHIFVQNDESLLLLKSIGISQCSRAGDTRFDRVSQIVKQNAEIEIAHRFKGMQKVFVVGSCWAEDMRVVSPFINAYAAQLKFIIAPHEITESFLRWIENSLEVRSIRFSQVQEITRLETYQVLIIDNVGMLSRLYRYGEFAFVGGAFGNGLHNILEAACYGIPIFFGNRNYKKYAEANELIMRGGAFEVADYTDLMSKYEMIGNPDSFLLACEVTRHYVRENLGATERIIGYCRTVLGSAE